MGTESTYPPGTTPLENIGQTLARELPKPQIVASTPAWHASQGGIQHVALPRDWKLHAIDDEALLEHPRRIVATVAAGDEESFIAYVNAHRDSSSALWVHFDPQTAALDFTAVFDDHRAQDNSAGSSDGIERVVRPGWRQHRATFKPAMSIEWKRWNGANRKSMSQVEFAEFIEENGIDIYAGEGAPWYPTEQQMLSVATQFVSRADMSVKSAVRLNSGGARLEYVNDPEAGTTDGLEIPQRFQIAIPVFWGVQSVDGRVPAYRIEARLKYRLAQQKVSFSFELVRPDKKHEAAALELIERIRVGVGSGGMPIFLGGA